MAPRPPLSRKIFSKLSYNRADWPCECRVGSCGTCRVILKEGKVKELADFAYTLDGDMLKEGYILACQSSLKSDLVVELDKEQKPL